MNYNDLVPIPGLDLDRADYKTNLQYHRNNARLTQKTLAERSGVNVRMIQHYEQGQKPINAASALTVHRLAKALHVTVEDLLEIE